MYKINEGLALYLIYAPVRSFYTHPSALLLIVPLFLLIPWNNIILVHLIFDAPFL